MQICNTEPKERGGAQWKGRAEQTQGKHQEIKVKFFVFY